MTEEEVKKRLYKYAETLLSVIDQACHVDTSSGRVFHKFIGAYEDAFELLHEDELLKINNQDYDSINWEGLSKFEDRK